MFKFIAVTVAVFALAASVAQADETDPNHYANQIPYGNPDSTEIATPPHGYEVFFLETVGRHGSRTMTSSATEDRVLKVWDAADKKGKVRSGGERLFEDVKQFQTDERGIGYGDLTALGETEWTGIGRRTAVNYKPFFDQMVTDGTKLALRTTDVYRTRQSAAALRDAIDEAEPGLRHAATVTDNKTLKLKSGASSAGNAAIAKALKASNVRRAANDVLHGLYTQAYVNSLSDPVGAALDVYLLYSTAPGLGEQTDVNFESYVPLADAKVLGYAQDAKNFYRYGPGVSGETSSYKSAEPLLKDFFYRLDARIKGGPNAAVFRLAHGETTMPFEALIRVPRSGTQVKKGSVYKYGTNPWRGAEAGRLAGNVEWAAYKNSTGHYLVTIRYNERPVQLGHGCKPTAAAPYFYRISTLKKCLS